MLQTPKINGSASAELDANAQVTAAGRFWQLCLAIEMGVQPRLRPTPSEPTFLEKRRIAELIGAAARRAVRLMFGVVLRDVSSRPEMFSDTVAALANNMAFEIGDSLSSFPFEERVRILDGLTQRLAQGLQIGLREPDEPAEIEEPAELETVQ